MQNGKNGLTLRKLISCYRAHLKEDVLSVLRKLCLIKVV